MTDVHALLDCMFDELINHGKAEVADELFAADFIDHGPMGDVVGREAFKELVLRWRSAVPDVHCDVENVFTQDDMVGWVVRATGTHTGDGLGFPATGRSFTTLTANIARFRDGIAIEHWAEQGMFPMLVQLGLIPSPAARR
jgi:predicted ester cyclase